MQTAAQNEAMNWCFGTNAGLSFTSSPPTSFTNSSMNTLEGCASVSSSTGSLLFYTDGITIWDQTHAVMANGSGLTGNSSSSQSGVIIKQPGNSTIYYVFSVPAAGVGALAYSIVDLSLAAGLGSVTTKNAVLFSPTAEKLTASRHCNGVDIWIVGHEQNSNVFRAYLLTPTGLSSTAVISSVGTSYSGFNYAGYMKTSPSGKKLAVSVYSGCLELFDFDNSTGTVSNPVVINSYSTMYGCEFSPDGSKLYAGTWFTTNPGLVYQYDLCAGSSAAIIASEMIIANSSPLKGALQQAPDGKIYVIRYGQSELGVINNPNLSGTLCNYVDQGQSIAPKTCVYGLPNFLTSDFEPPPTPFTHTISNSLGCQTASFNSTYNPTITTLACSAVGFSITGLYWNFGDPASGSANTSTLQSPVHAFSALGIYTINLILYYSCGGGTDTIRQVVNINCISVNSTSITCASLGSATVQALSGIGPFSYTWMPSSQTSSVANGLSPGTYTLTVFDAGTNFTYTTETIFTPLNPLTGKINTVNRVNCAGAATGTGNVTDISGGSGSQNYIWTNGSVTYTTANTNSLSAGVWTIIVSDAISGCKFGRVSYIKEPPAMNLTLSCNSPTACAGKSITLSGINSGGTPSLLGTGYTYTWVGGLASNTEMVTQNLGGTFVYSLYSRDSLNCLISQTISVDFISSPNFSLSGPKMQACAPFHSEFTMIGDSTNLTKVTWELNGKTFSSKSTFTYSFEKVGDYIFTGHFTDVLSACARTNTFLVRALSQPEADFEFEPKKSVEGMETTFFTNTSKGEELSNYSWHFITNSGYSSVQKNTSYYFSNAGKYPVALIVTDVNGCSDSIVKTVEILPDFAFYVPNAFTPNEDERNDVFFPVVKGVKFYEMVIFDRWGSRIFQSTDTDNGWDGSYKGQACKQDSYVWKVNLTTLGGEEKKYSGNVILFR